VTALDTFVAPPRQVFDQEVDAARDDEERDYSGWFCIATAPFPCPADGCTFVALHMTAAHLIVVWPQQDDPKLLAQARNAQQAGRKPRIVEYEQAMGPCIPIDVWLRAGRPVHGQHSAPDGWWAPGDPKGSRL
jgi:hypothetical protein